MFFYIPFICHRKKLIKFYAPPTVHSQFHHMCIKSQLPHHMLWSMGDSFAFARLHSATHKSNQIKIKLVSTLKPSSCLSSISSRVKQIPCNNGTHHVLHTAFHLMPGPRTQGTYLLNSSVLDPKKYARRMNRLGEIEWTPAWPTLCVVCSGALLVAGTVLQC